MKCYSDKKFTAEGGVEIRLEGNILRMFFDFGEETQEREDMSVQPKKGEKPKMVQHTVYTAENVDVFGNRDYPIIVSAIVRDRYSDDDVTAILANHAADADTPSTFSVEKKTEHEQEYKDFQAWRNHAKEIAKIVMSKL